MHATLQLWASYPLALRTRPLSSAELGGLKLAPSPGHSQLSVPLTNYVGIRRLTNFRASFFRCEAMARISLERGQCHNNYDRLIKALKNIFFHTIIHIPGGVEADLVYGSRQVPYRFEWFRIRAEPRCSCRAAGTPIPTSFQALLPTINIYHSTVTATGYVTTTGGHRQLGPQQTALISETVHTVTSTHVPHVNFTITCVSV